MLTHTHIGNGLRTDGQYSINQKFRVRGVEPVEFHSGQRAMSPEQREMFRSMLRRHREDRLFERAEARRKKAIGMFKNNPDDGRLVRGLEAMESDGHFG